MSELTLSITKSKFVRAHGKLTVTSKITHAKRILGHDKLTKSECV